MCVYNAYVVVGTIFIRSRADGERVEMGDIYLINKLHEMIVKFVSTQNHADKPTHIFSVSYSPLAPFRQLLGNAIIVVQSAPAVRQSVVRIAEITWRETEQKEQQPLLKCADICVCEIYMEF